VTLRASWVTLRARWVTLRARWVTFTVERQRQGRAAELNRVGVFGKNVNSVRAGSMYRVELRRKMQPTALKQKPVEAEEPKDSMEVSLQALIDDLDMASGTKKPNAKVKPAKQRARSVYQQMEQLMAADGSPAGKAVKEAKLDQWDTQSAAAVERYRRQVQQRRDELLQRRCDTPPCTEREWK
jgi:hypothetical protein